MADNLYKKGSGTLVPPNLFKSNCEAKASLPEYVLEKNNGQ